MYMYMTSYIAYHTGTHLTCLSFGMFFNCISLM